MSRSKKLGRSAETAFTVTPTRRRRYWRPAMIVAAIAIVAIYWTFESPQAYYRRALQLLPGHPSQAERLAETAVTKAFGNYPAAQLLQCQALAAMGEWDSALGGFSLIKNPRSCSAEALLDLATKALEAGQFQLADRVIQAARVPGPEYSRATELLVRLKLQFHRQDEALSLCREWQAVAPDAPLPWVIAAEIEVAQFELAAGLADYQQALQRAPERELELSIRGSLARLLVLAGDLPAARIQYDKLLEFGAVPTSVQVEYVQLLRSEGRLTEALAEIERYRTDVGNTPEILKRRGQIHLDLGQLDEALADLQQSVAGNSLDIGTHHLLAQIYLRRGKPDLAEQHLRKSRRLTNAKIRIPELEDLIRSDPTNAEWRRELKELTSDSESK